MNTQSDIRLGKILSLINGDIFKGNDRLTDEASNLIRRCDAARRRGELDEMELRHRALLFLSKHTPKTDVFDIETISNAILRLCSIIEEPSDRA